MITHEMKVIEQICTQVAVIDGGNIIETGNVKDVFYDHNQRLQSN